MTDLKALNPVYPAVGQDERSANSSRMHMVKTLAQLKAVDTRALETSTFTYCAGRTAISDGFEGIFRYIRDDTTTADDGTVIAPTDNGGRWIRPETQATNQHKIQARWYSTIIAAVTAANALRVCTLCLEPITYSWVGVSNLLSGVNLIGAGVSIPASASALGTHITGLVTQDDDALEFASKFEHIAFEGGLTLSTPYSVVQSCYVAGAGLTLGTVDRKCHTCRIENTVLTADTSGTALTFTLRSFGNEFHGEIVVPIKGRGVFIDAQASSNSIFVEWERPTGFGIKSLAYIDSGPTKLHILNSTGSSLYQEDGGDYVIADAGAVEFEGAVANTDYLYHSEDQFGTSRVNAIGRDTILDELAGSVIVWNGVSDLRHLSAVTDIYMPPAISWGRLRTLELFMQGRDPPMNLYTSIGIKTSVINAAGTGYAVDDVLSIDGGTVPPGPQPATSTWTAKVLVTAVGGSGEITATTLVRHGRYVTAPALANTPTGGGGSGATLTLTLNGDGISILFTSVIGNPVVLRGPGRVSFTRADSPVAWIMEVPPTVVVELKEDDVDLDVGLLRKVITNNTSAITITSVSTGTSTNYNEYHEVVLIAGDINTTIDCSANASIVRVDDPGIDIAMNQGSVVRGWNYNSIFYCRHEIIAPYVTAGTDLNGTTQHFEGDATIIGPAADSNKLLVSFCYKPSSSGSGVDQILSMNDGGSAGHHITYDNAGELNIVFDNTAGTAIFVLTTTDTPIIEDAWNHIILSFDLSVANSTRLYVNNQLGTDAPSTFTDDTVEWSAIDDFDIGRSTGGVGFLQGCLTEFYLHIGIYRDLNIEYNRRKFINALNQPVNLGADGHVPFNAQPELYLRGAASAFATNLGSGADLTAIATPGTCSTNPTDNPPA